MDADVENETVVTAKLIANECTDNEFRIDDFVSCAVYIRLSSKPFTAHQQYDDTYQKINSNISSTLL